MHQAHLREVFAKAAGSERGHAEAVAKVRPLVRQQQVHRKPVRHWDRSWFQLGSVHIRRDVIK